MILDLTINRNNHSTNNITSSDVLSRLKLLDEVAVSIEQFHPTQIITMLSDAGGTYLESETFDEILVKFSNTCIAENQFYTVYDVNVGWHTIIDPKISNVLGIEPSEFSLRAMAGLDSSNPLFHPDDVYHMIRWASLGYMLLSFPGFQWETLKSYYYVSHRVGTSNSRIKHLRDKKFVTLEKRCFPLFSTDRDGVLKPIFHFDQWSVMDATDFDYVKPKWITSLDQNDEMNALFYMFNAYLLNITTKHICILAERQKHDRNKAAANSMNAKILQGIGVNAQFDEYELSNALSKTIRSKVSHAMNTWDKRSHKNRIDIRGDQEAVHYGKMLGLLPMPKKVEEMIYQSLTIQ